MVPPTLLQDFFVYILLQDRIVDADEFGIVCKKVFVVLLRHY